MRRKKSNTRPSVSLYHPPLKATLYQIIIIFLFFSSLRPHIPFPNCCSHLKKKISILLTLPPSRFLIQVFIKNRNTCLVQLPWVVHLHRLFLLQLLLQRRRRHHPIQSVPSVHHLSFLVLSVIPPPPPPLMQNHHHHHQQQKPQRPSHHQLQQQQLVLLQHLKYLIPHFQVELVPVMVVAMGREVPVLALVVQHSTTH